MKIIQVLRKKYSRTFRNGLKTRDLADWHGVCFRWSVAGETHMQTLPNSSQIDSFSNGDARVLCYALGPLSGALMLRFSQRSENWAIRFHAFHSIVIGVFWAMLWSTLVLLESISPWFMGAVLREIQFATNLYFVAIWCILMMTAYRGERFVSIPFLHDLAVRFANARTRATA